jgi:hypothetical protein
MCCAGTLKTKRELYKAAKSLVGSLNDQYSAFLDPSAFRTAIRRPTKAELGYLSEQAVGAKAPLKRAFFNLPTWTGEDIHVKATVGERCHGRARNENA